MESFHPLFEAIAFRVKEEETETVPAYVVPCVQVPAPSAVGVEPSFVQQIVAPAVPVEIVTVWVGPYVPATGLKVGAAAEPLMV